MQFVLESQINKSATTIDVGDDVDLVVLNGEVFVRQHDEFKCLGVPYDWNTEQAKKQAEKKATLHGLPSFPAKPTDVAEADSISRSTTQSFE